MPLFLVPLSFAICLLEQGCHQLAALGKPDMALAMARARLPECEPGGELAGLETLRFFDVWPEWVTLNSLTETANKEGYLRIMDRALLPDSHAICGTFAPGGPTSCSGPPVACCADALLFGGLDKGSDCSVSLKHDCNTPSGSLKRFHFGVFRKA